MAFFVGTYPPDVPQDSNGGFLGLVNNPFNPANTYFPATVAVEFDAFRNDWDPKDTMSHVGVDVNNISPVAYAALPDGCFNGAMSAWVRYDANASTLSVTLRFDDQPGLGVYNVNAPVDLRAEGLPQQAAVGFSAATGDYVESHQILSWSFESALTNVAVINKTGKWPPLLLAVFLLVFPLMMMICVGHNLYLERCMNLMHCFPEMKFINRAWKIIVELCPATAHVFLQNRSMIILCACSSSANDAHCFYKSLQ